MKFLRHALLAAYDIAVFYLGILSFGLACLVWTVLAIALFSLLPRTLSCNGTRFAIMAGFRGFLAFLVLTGRFRFELDELDQLRNESSLIIAPNHPSLWDAMLVVSRLPNIACIMKKEIINNVMLGTGARLARYIRNESPRQMIMQAVAELQRGSRILLFPEGTRTVRPPVNPLKGSIGIIAARAQVPVQTVLIETDSPFLGKGWPIYKKPGMPVTVRVRLGRRFAPAENSAVLVAEIEQYFINELAACQHKPCGDAIFDASAVPLPADPVKAP